MNRGFGARRGGACHLPCFVDFVPHPLAGRMTHRCRRALEVVLELQGTAVGLLPAAHAAQQNEELRSVPPILQWDLALDQIRPVRTRYCISWRNFPTMGFRH